MVAISQPTQVRRNFSFYDKKLRGIAYQTALAVSLAVIIAGVATQTVSNMKQRGIPLTFDFWKQTSGFQINQTLIPYDSLSTYGQAFWVGVANTLLVSAIGIMLATVIGFLVGISRLSANWIAAKVAASYVEVIRNVPLLLQLLFWYNAVLKPLPAPKASISLPGGIYLNNRGIIMPAVELQAGAGWIGVAVVAAVAVAVAFGAYTRTVQKRTGKQLPILLVTLIALIGLPLLASLVVGNPWTFIYPELKGFNFRGGLQIYPEFAALLIGLSVYTASFIAEIVRGGIQAVSRGQTEAAHALGFSNGKTLRLVVVPQALRIIIPPLTSQYLNLIKNSSLAVFIGYPDLVQVFAGSVLNQTGAAVQVMAITLAVYLVISLITSAAMNGFNQRFALVER
ncbi:MULTISPECIES: amino acid ABC transporter permease [unclassified Rhizobium]|jgi:general L-amino acid transport system permease protein|uniref:amino acid ABC transporter permease n=1 Tax=unclassified Rhizobium TaxID=2613769 RepID=UPI001A99A88A|nr:MULTISPECIES: amino acid ABC transporter permease [unclassified Rhizobium]MBX5166442.1 amino acid ABC transporter permease [Rhizobium sp. NZLR4b]MBX5182555.1 amino acid ABC transporter permease [Rhizobium sp. NZLR5]MBX5194669.1 amino acid ABC transporter permease [Rhizobium sp. NZLR10]MBX5201191.1 amino acid ABC transporter permease [Rhizobium sp. NZLR1]MBX5210313.1 amino acid ABC transporter permease [Rhizobium sp. NZLR11]